MAPLTRARALLPGWRAAVVCMLVGVLLTVAVSWVLAVGYGRVGGWKLPTPQSRVLASEHDPEFARKWLGATTVPEIPWPIDVPDDWPIADFEHRAMGFGCRRLLTGSLRLDEPTEAYVLSQTSGLPLAGLRSDQQTYGGKPLPTGPWHTGIELDSGARLPLRPIWPAFLANTAFYAMLTWAAALGVRALRNRIRLKPGQCPHCRYDATGLTQCPECGTFLVVKKEQCNE